MKDDFTREELFQIQGRCGRLSKIVENSYWKRLYDDLNHAARHLELQISRVTVKAEEEKK